MRFLCSCHKSDAVSCFPSRSGGRRHRNVRKVSVVSHASHPVFKHLQPGSANADGAAAAAEDGTAPSSPVGAGEFPYYYPPSSTHCYHHHRRRRSSKKNCAIM